MPQVSLSAVAVATRRNGRVDMAANPNASINQLRAKLAGLTQSCPVDQSNPIDCPLYALRQMASQDRQQWFYALSEDDLQYLADYHQLCSQIRIHSRPPLHELPPPSTDQPTA